MTPEQAKGVRTRARRGEGDRLRGEILDATERLLIRTGTMEDVSIRAIADAVGVAPPSLYLHFADKDDLFFHVCERRFSEFGDALAAAAAVARDPVDRVAELGHAYIRYGIEHPEQYRILFGPKMETMLEGRDLADTAGARSFAILVDAVAAGIEAGSLRGSDPVLVAFGLWAAVHGAVLLLAARSEFGRVLAFPEPEVLATQVMEQCLDGVRR